MKTIECKGDAKLVSMPSQTTLNLDDVPDHILQLSIEIYEHTCTCPEIGDFRQYIYSNSDTVAGTGTGCGYWTDVTKTGDKIFGKTSSSVKTEVIPDGSWEMTFTGEWEATGGTGKFEGIKGKGSFAGKGTSEEISYQWEGSLDLPD
jgi:hypothetical protein